jgi:hypothetical protein
VTVAAPYPIDYLSFRSVKIEIYRISDRRTEPFPFLISGRFPDNLITVRPGYRKPADSKNIILKQLVNRCVGSIGNRPG